MRDGVYAKRDFSIDEVDYLNSPIDIFSAIKRAVANKNLDIQKSIKDIKEATVLDSPIADVVGRCHDILFYARTMFPFHIFRNTVILDRERISIIYPFFFFSKKIVSIPVRDLLNVEASVGPLFGSVKMSSRYFVATPCIVNYLKRSNALRLQRLLHGYIICEEQKIDCSGIPKEKLILLLNDLGEGNVRLAHG